MRGFVSAVLAVLAFSPLAAQAGDWREKVDSQLLDKMGTGSAEFIVFLREQADLSGARRFPDKTEKGRFVYERLRQTAENNQGPLLEALKARGVEHRAYWIADMVWVKGDRATLEAMAMREDVARVYANPRVRFAEPRPSAGGSRQPEVIEWNISKVKADQAWALGYRGLGAVVAGGDTGYQWDHPALVGKYRGWSGSAANHNYNWHDAIHSGGGVCGPNSAQPCDDYPIGHGSHTMGTMVGDEGGANQIGMAPDAKWIGCRNMNVGDGTPTTYAECYQFFLAPTDLTGANPNPALAPDVINNSWGCPPSEGCTDPNVLRAIVENTRAAGIVPVASAGNDGPSCGTVRDPAAIYDASFTVGSTDSTDAAAGESSRGPVTVDGSNRLKPDVAAPGVGVRSSVPGGYNYLSGTSMAGPHVAGLVALMISANNNLAGRVGQIERIVRRTAVPLGTAETCGGLAAGVVPNNTFGYGRIDALAATQAAADWIFADGFDPDI